MNYKALDEDIICGEDGYWIWWPTGNRGAHNENSLRIVLQILSELNDVVQDCYDNDDDMHMSCQNYPNCDEFGCGPKESFYNL